MREQAANDGEGRRFYVKAARDLWTRRDVAVEKTTSKIDEEERAIDGEGRGSDGEGLTTARHRNRAAAKCVDRWTDEPRDLIREVRVRKKPRGKWEMFSAAVVDSRVAADWRNCKQTRRCPNWGTQERRAGRDRLRPSGEAPGSPGRHASLPISQSVGRRLVARYCDRFSQNTQRNSHAAAS